MITGKRVCSMKKRGRCDLSSFLYGYNYSLQLLLAKQVALTSTVTTTSTAEPIQATQHPRHQMPLQVLYAQPQPFTADNLSRNEAMRRFSEADLTTSNGLHHVVC